MLFTSVVIGQSDILVLVFRVFIKYRLYHQESLGGATVRYSSKRICKSKPVLLGGRLSRYNTWQWSEPCLKVSSHLPECSSQTVRIRRRCLLDLWSAPPPSRTPSHWSTGQCSRTCYWSCAVLGAERACAGLGQREVKGASLLFAHILKTPSHYNSGPQLNRFNVILRCARLTR